MSIADVVDEQPRRPAVVGDEHVRVAVVVDIAKTGAAAHFGLLKHRSGPIGDVFEAAITEVAEQAFVFLVRKLMARARGFERNRAVHGEKVQPSVVVVVEPGGPETGKAQTARTQGGPGTLVVESTAAVVDEQIVALVRERRD